MSLSDDQAVAAGQRVLTSESVKKIYRWDGVVVVETA